MNDTVHEISGLYSEVEHLRSKDRENEKLIHVLKRQNEVQAMEMSQMAADHADEVRKLKQRCDLAVRRETEITGILNTVANSIILGMRKMKGDETPPKMPERELPAIEDRRLPEVSRDERLPAPDFAHFAPPPHRPRPPVTEDIDDGIADIVSRFPRSERG